MCILCVKLDNLYELAKLREEVEISSMCTTFTESEIISLMGREAAKEDIARYAGAIGAALMQKI